MSGPSQSDVSPPSGEDPTLIAADESADAEEAGHRLRRGTPLGPYVVLDELGAGGMGVVYAAYDPRLDRKVAVKLLRPGQRHGAEARARLGREAQAMARLTHPNVVTVHDVGEVDEQVFVAMEFVEGETVKDWVRGAERSWRDVIAVYLGAGQGLAAAHRAGLVHRDFKPENVMVADDGRVLVMDFGLARETQPSAKTQLPISTEGGSAGSSGDDLTRTGTLLGTPAYMAPEQLHNKSADARSDQFSYCVALYEGLYGQRPFAGDSLAELVAAISAGRVRDTPARSRVPSSVRTAILKGLERRPKNRFETMDALLAELAAGPKRARRRMAWVGGSGMLVVLVVAAWALAGATPQLCAGAEERVAKVWNDSRRGEVASAFADTRLPLAAKTWAAAQMRLSTYTDAWRSMYTEACEATHVRGEQSEARLDARMDCLAERLDRVDAVLEEFAAADQALISRAMDVVLRLPPIADCDHTADAPNSDAPSDPQSVDRVRRAKRHLASARTRNDAGRYERGLKSVASGFEVVGDLEAPRLRGELLLSRGQIQRRAGDPTGSETSLREALPLAVEAHAERLEAELWLQLVDTVGYGQQRAKEAKGLALAADIAVLAAGDLPAQRHKYLSRLAMVHLVAGELDEASALLEQAIATARPAGEGGAVALAVQHNNFGLGLYEQSKFDEALQHHEKAVELAADVYGEEHPFIAIAVSNVARDLQALGRGDEALERFEYGLGLRQRMFGDAHEHTAESLLNIAQMLANKGRYDEARPMAKRALDIWIDTLGPEHPYVAFAHNALGNMDQYQGDFDSAFEHYSQLARLFEKTYGLDHAKMLTPLINLGSVSREQERLEEALEYFRRARDLAVKHLPPDHADHGLALSGLGSTLDDQGRHAEAIEPLERAVAIFEKGAGPRQVAATYLALAQARWSADEDRPRAILLGKKARTTWIEAGIEEPEDLAKIDRWLRARGVESKTVD